MFPQTDKFLHYCDERPEEALNGSSFVLDRSSLSRQRGSLTDVLVTYEFTHSSCTKVLYEKTCCIHLLILLTFVFIMYTTIYAPSQITLTNVWRLYLLHASESEVLLHKYCRVLMVISSKRVQNSKNFVSQISTTVYIIRSTKFFN